MKIQKIQTLVIFILIPILIGNLSSLLTKNTQNVYTELIKPDFSPPAALFPIVWFILYVLMGISSYLIYSSDSPYKESALRIYALQLIFNFFWSLIFFGLQMYFFAFIWILCLIVLIVLMILAFYRVSPIAAILQIPYLIWCIIAAYLNYAIYQLNK